MSTRNSYIVMIAASVAVVTLVGWALSRSFTAPVTSSIPVVETASAPGFVPSRASPAAPSGEPPQSAEEAAVVRIGPEDLRQRTLRGEVTVIDVRSAGDFELGHLPGSLNVPLATVEAQIAYLPKGKLIVAYCTWPAEESSARAALILKHSGITNVSALQGGLHAWENAGFPIAKGRF